MKKDDINIKLRDYVESKLSVTGADRRFVKKIYKSVRDVFGKGNCYQIGSWARGTAIRPLDDLDVILVIGNAPEDWGNNPPGPKSAIENVSNEVNENLKPPDGLKIRTEIQSHSCGVFFVDEKGEEVFTVDLVPAYILDKNYEYDHDTYLIPEIAGKPHAEKMNIYKSLREEGRTMDWKPSDPRGYRKAGKALHDICPDFRPAVKFMKAWKKRATDRNGETFELKSFHIEQKLYEYYKGKPNKTIFDGVYSLLREISIHSPFFTATIADIAQPNPPIDKYVEDLTDRQKEVISNVRNHTLVALENVEPAQNFEETLLNGELYEQPLSEEFLFNKGSTGIPIFVEGLIPFKFEGKVLATETKEEFFLHENANVVEPGRQIEFRLSPDSYIPDGWKILWKVRNDSRTCTNDKQRGDITNDRTRHDPEETEYIGEHYVEAYLIKNSVCVEKFRHPVIIEA